MKAKTVSDSLNETIQVPFTNKNKNLPITGSYPLSRMQYEDADKKMTNKKKALIDLYNAINNDYSIRRYSLGWKDVLEQIQKLYKQIPENKEIDFENDILIKAIDETSGKINSILKNFAKELNINMETLRDKYKEKYK